MTISFKHLNQGIIQFSNKFIYFSMMKHTASIQRQELPLDNSLGNFSSLHFEVNFEENRIKSMDVGSTKAQLSLFWETLESTSGTYVLKEGMVCRKKKNISTFSILKWFLVYHIELYGSSPKTNSNSSGAPDSFSLRFQHRIRYYWVFP